MARIVGVPTVETELADLKKRVTDLERKLRDAQRDRVPTTVTFHVDQGGGG